MKFILGMITGIVISSFFFLWYAKKKLSNYVPQTTEVNANAPTTEAGDFADFYQRFHSDSLYQLAHIVFPLEGIPRQDSTGAVPENFHWQQENWVLHQALPADDTTFVQHINHLTEDMVIDQIMDKKGMFGLQRRFARIGDEWQLIFYAAMNPLME